MKTATIAKIAHFFFLERFAYFLNRKRKRIITFHNIIPDNLYYSNIANGVSNSVSEFSKIITEVGKKFKFSLDLNDPSSVTVTFDDGYLNQFEIALPYLASKKIPAIVFVSGQIIKENESSKIDELIIDKLLHWISFVPEGNYKLNIKNKFFPLQVDKNNRQKLWAEILWPLFLDDTESKGLNLFRELNKLHSYQKIKDTLPTEYVRLRIGGPTIEKISQSKDLGFEIGYHGYSHFPFSKLSEEEKQKELIAHPACNSKVFSFPYGGLKEVDEKSIRILKELGYTDGVSNIQLGNEKYGNWFRSRMSLSSDKLLLHFELSGLKYLLKYGKLLPKI